ncbi:MAG: FAD-dependent oxidoreductase [Lachnospiraceae bacterium]|nr:FAD-dependent oxidoreductase [Lachnospiraceae bacterium]
MTDNENLYDLVIVGGGPAGLSAAIYMARAKYKVLVLEKEKTGGQITITSEVVNYPGVELASGKSLTDSMRKQAEGFGAAFAIAEVKDMNLDQEIKEIHTSKGDYRAFGVILAVGANPRRLGFEGENTFRGRGVAYCATCDGEFFTGMNVFVIGGGFAAVEEGIFLTKYAKHVTIIVRSEDFSCAKTVSDKLKEHDRITVRFSTELKKVEGSQRMEKAVFMDRTTGETWEYDAGKEGGFGVFVFAGYEPNTRWLPEALNLNEQGYILTDANQKTNLPGVYAAGDVCVKNLRQVVTAVADGAIAATSLEKDVTELHKKLGIPEFTVNIPKKMLQPGTGESGQEPDGQAEAGEFLNASIRAQLAPVFAKFQNPVHVRAWLGEDKVSDEVKGFLDEFTEMTDRISWEQAPASEMEPEEQPEYLPSMEILQPDKTPTGMIFHGVPGGHEINSFVVALYNAAGPGTGIADEERARIEGLSKKLHLEIMVSLSCTMCPELVMSAQKIASLSDHVTAEVFDLAHYPKLKEHYQVMSVPCMVVNRRKVYFGKKNVSELLDILEAE